MKKKKKTVRRDTAGRFLPGTCGGPGNPNLVRIARLRAEIQRAVGPAAIKSVFRTLVRNAKAGDTDSARLLLSYVVGKPRAMPADDAGAVGGGMVNLDVTDSRGCAEAARSVLGALSEGRIDPDQALKISGVVELARRSLEQHEIAQRLAVLEDQGRLLE